MGAGVNQGVVTVSGGVKELWRERRGVTGRMTGPRKRYNRRQHTGGRSCMQYVNYVNPEPQTPFLASCRRRRRRTGVRRKRLRSWSSI